MDPSSRRVGIELKRRKRVVLENRSVWGRPALEGQCVSVRGREDSVHPHGLSEGNKTIPRAREGFSYDDLEPALLEHRPSQALCPAQAFPGLCLGAQHPLCPAQPRRQPAPHRLAVRQGGRMPASPALPAPRAPHVPPGPDTHAPSSTWDALS